MALPLVDRKARLAALVKGAPESLQYNDHQIGQGPAFHRLACQHGLEGIVSKRVTGRYEPDRRSWLKPSASIAKNSSSSDGAIPRAADIGSARYSSATARGMGSSSMPAEWAPGCPTFELERLWQRLQPLAVDKMPLALPPPRGSRFGSPLVLSRVHWVRPEMVAEVTYAEWTPDRLVRHLPAAERSESTRVA
jgi:bifunctional non-homologous end joining protein LigD